MPRGDAGFRHHPSAYTAQIFYMVNDGRLDILGDGLYIKSAEWTFWVITEQ